MLEFNDMSLADVQFACPHCRSPISLNEDGVLCAVCGFKATRIEGIYSFLDQQSSVDEWQDTFEGLAAGPLGDTSTAVEYRSARQQKYLISAFRRVCGVIPPQAKILDVGCGNGIFSHALLGGRSVIGVDYSASMCFLANKRNLRAFQANAFALPFADQQFDLVYSAELLQYAEDLTALLAEFARICKPGGRVIVSTLNAVSVLRWVFRIARLVMPGGDEGTHSPLIKRSIRQISDSARGIPLDLDIVCWNHFPFSWVLCRSSARNVFAWAATNLVVCFVKKGH